MRDYAGLTVSNDVKADHCRRPAGDGTYVSLTNAFQLPTAPGLAAARVGTNVVVCG